MNDRDISDFWKYLEESVYKKYECRWMDSRCIWNGELNVTEVKESKPDVRYRSIELEEG